MAEEITKTLEHMKRNAYQRGFHAAKMEIYFRLKNAAVPMNNPGAGWRQFLSEIRNLEADA